MTIPQSPDQGEMVAIPHTGTKPAWLEDDALITNGDIAARAAIWNWGAFPNYFLEQVDHWAAPVLLAGLTPWNPKLQGDGPPPDYAGGKVMLRNGHIREDKTFLDDPENWSHNPETLHDIIGYEFDPPCTACGGTGITFQTERRCACLPSPAQHPKPAQDVEQGDIEAAYREGHYDGKHGSTVDISWMDSNARHRLASSREAELERRLHDLALVAGALVIATDGQESIRKERAAVLDELRALAQTRGGGEG